MSFVSIICIIHTLAFAIAISLSFRVKRLLRRNCQPLSGLAQLRRDNFASVVRRKQRRQNPDAVHCAPGVISDCMGIRLDLLPHLSGEKPPPNSQELKLFVVALTFEGHIVYRPFSGLTAGQGQLNHLILSRFGTDGSFRGTWRWLVDKGRSRRIDFSVPRRSCSLPEGSAFSDF